MPGSTNEAAEAVLAGLFDGWNVGDRLRFRRRAQAELSSRPPTANVVVVGRCEAAMNEFNKRYYQVRPVTSDLHYYSTMFWAYDDELSPH